MTETSPPPIRRCAPDPTRAILRVTGPDRVKFLQGLVTNDMNRLTRTGILYGAILTPQGKYLTDFLLVPDGETILIDTPVAASEDLLRRLTLYRLRSDVQVERTDLVVTTGLGPAPDGALTDPRHSDLGWRLYGQSLTEGEAVDWPARHISLMVPAHETDLIPNDSYILEMGFARLNGVDFRKGCYVGQEVTARMHHKTDLRKGLVAVQLDGTASPGDPILTADGREAGRMGTVAGDRALAFLRLDRATGPLTAGAATVLPDLPQSAPGPA